MKVYVAKFINNELIIEPYKFKNNPRLNNNDSKNKLTDTEILNLIDDHKLKKYPIRELLNKYEISMSTLYRYLKKETKCPTNLNTLLG